MEPGSGRAGNLEGAPDRAEKRGVDHEVDNGSVYLNEDVGVEYE